MNRKVVIVSAVRTPGGAFGGALKGLTAADLGAQVIKEAVRRAGISGSQIEQVIFGNGWQAGVGPNVARLSTVMAGLPYACPAFTVNIRCGSGLRAVELGALSIAGGETDIVIAGGTESSSNVPYILPEARWGHRMGDKKAIDVLHRDGFMCPLADMMMGGTGELLAQRFGITRHEQDQFSLESHVKATTAMEKGLFSEEIVPVSVADKKGERIIDTDEIPRKNASLEGMAKLPPVFSKDGTVTAGNSCALCDGAAAVVLMSADKAAELGIKPLAAIRSYSYVALEPKYMGLGPVNAIPDALAKAGINLGDIDLIEVNEAFAVQVIACKKELKLDRDKLNVHGGAIALGHPVGATGAKILTTIIYALKNRNQTTGLASLCIGGGQGVAMVVERLD